MLAHTRSVALVGTEACLVDVEVDVAAQGLPGFAIVGLPAASVKEATQRVRSALIASDCTWPQRRIVANLAPGGLRKEGTHLDLALAVGVVVAGEQLDPARAEGWMFVGELALDGCVRAVRGVLAAAICCRTKGLRGLVCPASNAPEAALVEGIDVVPVRNMRECVGFLSGTWTPPAVDPAEPDVALPSPDMAEVRGQEHAKNALELAAAGGHNVLMIGCPGAGKTMLASRLPGILPPMSAEESLEVTKVHSIAGFLVQRPVLIVDRPFRAPHHTISIAALIGGGSGVPRPGEISLANHGVLFMDELPLFGRALLESLRGPLEEGFVRLARSAGVVEYACSFSLIAAMNPCPCGYNGDDRRQCCCPDPALQRYGSRLSGPLIDRFDMQVAVPRVTRQDLMKPPDGERSQVIRDRVTVARARQSERYESPTVNNGSAPNHFFALERFDLRLRQEVAKIVEGQRLTGRGMNRLLRVARTVADLAGDDRLTIEHLFAAAQFRVEPVSHEGAA